MSFAKTPLVFKVVFVVAAATIALHADGDRGIYAGFGARINETQPVVLENSEPMPRITTTAYRASSERVEGVHVVDEEASVRFQLIGLPAAAQPTDYRVTWKFDDAHKGVDEQTLRPTQTSTVNIRYNTSNASHHIVELRIVSLDGRWAGTTSFPAFGRADSALNVAEGNVLLVPMKAKQTVN